MEDFLVKKTGAEVPYMYIGFTDRRKEDRMVNCCGLAKVLLDNNYECWFNYSFHHSPDWNEVSGMLLTPNRKYKISGEEIRKLGNEIIYNIREFISRMN